MIELYILYLYINDVIRMFLKDIIFGDNLFEFSVNNIKIFFFDRDRYYLVCCK